MADIKQAPGEKGGPDAPPRLDTPFGDAIVWGMGKGNKDGVEAMKLEIPSLSKKK